MFFNCGLISIFQFRTGTLPPQAAGIPANGIKAEKFVSLRLAFLCLAAIVVNLPVYAYQWGEGSWVPAGKRVYVQAAAFTGVIEGSTKYHISYYEGASGIESELEFPLDNTVAGFSVSAGYGDISDKLDRIKLSLVWFTNAEKNSSEMKDSDWLTDDLDIDEVGQAHPGLDIYSESASGIEKQTICDVSGVFNFFPLKFLAVGPVAGFKYYDLGYNITDVNQVGYGPYAGGYTASVAGKALKYGVKYSMPYLGINMDAVTSGGALSVNISGKYSKWVRARDVDDHLLRAKRCRSTCRGSGYILSFLADWQFLPRWALEIGGESVDIDTKGTQKQYFYFGDYELFYGDVDNKITQKYNLFYAGVKYRF